MSEEFDYSKLTSEDRAFVKERAELIRKTVELIQADPVLKEIRRQMKRKLRSFERKVGTEDALQALTEAVRSMPNCDFKVPALFALEELHPIRTQ